MATLNINDIAVFDLDAYKPGVSTVNVGWVILEIAKRTRTPDAVMSTHDLSRIFPFVKLSSHNPTQCAWWPLTGLSTALQGLISVEFVCTKRKPTHEVHRVDTLLPESDTEREAREARGEPALLESSKLRIGELLTRIRLVFHLESVPHIGAHGLAVSYTHNLRPICVRFKKGSYARTETVFSRTVGRFDPVVSRDGYCSVVGRLDRDAGWLKTFMNRMSISFSLLHAIPHGAVSGPGKTFISMHEMNVRDIVRNYFDSGAPRGDGRWELNRQAREKLYGAIALSIDGFVQATLNTTPTDAVELYTTPHGVRTALEAAGIWEIREWVYRSRVLTSRKTVRALAKMLFSAAKEFTAWNPVYRAENLWESLLRLGVKKEVACLFSFVLMVQYDVNKWAEAANVSPAVDNLFACLFADRTQRCAAAARTILLEVPVPAEIRTLCNDVLHSVGDSWVVRRIMKGFCHPDVWSSYFQGRATRKPALPVIRSEFCAIASAFHTDLLLFACDVLMVHDGLFGVPRGSLTNKIADVARLVYFSQTDVSYAYSPVAAAAGEINYTHGLPKEGLNYATNSGYTPYSVAVLKTFRDFAERSRLRGYASAIPEALQNTYKPRYYNALCGRSFEDYRNGTLIEYQKAVSELRIFSEAFYSRTIVDVDGNAANPYRWTNDLPFTETENLPLFVGDNRERDIAENSEEEEEEEEDENA